MSILSEKIKFYRKQKGFSQRDMAKKLNLSQPGYAKYENDLAEPDISRLNLLSQIFNVSLEELMTGSDKEPQIPDEKTNWVATTTPQQITLFKMIQQLDNDAFYMVLGYVKALLQEARA